MRAVIQRANSASVDVDGTTTGQIRNGLVVLLGISQNDTSKSVEWLSRKIVGLRIFSDENDENDKMNKSVLDIDGEILLISQFTLYANTKKGNRPSFSSAAKASKAMPLYEEMIAKLESLLNKRIQTGIFGAMMNVQLINNGPVTILIDTEEYSIE